MKKYILNKVFENQEECDKWEKENLTVNDRQMYNNEYIFMVMHDVDMKEHIVLTEIWVC